MGRLGGRLLLASRVAPHFYPSDLPSNAMFWPLDPGASQSGVAVASLIRLLCNLLAMDIARLVVGVCVTSMIRLLVRSIKMG